MKALSLNAKIFMIIGFLVAMSGFILYRSLADLATINQQLNFVIDNTVEKVKAAGRINQRIIDIGRTEKLMILTDREDEVKGNYQQIVKLKAELKEQNDIIVGLADETDKQSLIVLSSKLDQYYTHVDKVYEYALQNTTRKSLLLTRGKGEEAFQKISDTLDRLKGRAASDKSEQILSTASSMESLIRALRTGERDLILSTAEEMQQRIESRQQQLRMELNQNAARLQRAARGNLANLADRLNNDLNNFLKVHEEIMAMATINSNALADELSGGAARQVSDEAREIMRQLIFKMDEDMAADKLASDVLYENSRNSLLLTSAVGILLSLTIAGFILLNLSRRITKIINSLRESSSEVANASLQLSSSAQQLSNMSTEQAGSIEETSSSLEEISGMIDNNLINTKETVELMKIVCGTSKEGNQLMEVVEDSMEKIHKSNDQIKDLVKIIANIGEKTQVMDEIVFQTKLLSFNASVEAERAGEHGRGFAVVAQEVGNLAAMSGKAAQEIAQIVKHSIKEAEQITESNKSLVDKGVEYVKETATKLRDILSSSEDVAARAQEVLTASQEQSGGVKQINTAISQLDKATQENAASAEEAASTSEELSSQTETLAAVVRDLTLAIRGSSNELNEEYQKQQQTVQRHRSAQAHHGHGTVKQAQQNVYHMDHFKGNEAPKQTYESSHHKMAVGAGPEAAPPSPVEDRDDAWDRL
ncbi:MAG: methyl-accepting chemotaxis protein [Oligoflexus sp.]